MSVLAISVTASVDDVIVDAGLAVITASANDVLVDTDVAVMLVLVAASANDVIVDTDVTVMLVLVAASANEMIVDTDVVSSSRINMVVGLAPSVHAVVVTLEVFLSAISPRPRLFKASTCS